MKEKELVILSRDVDAIIIPDGHKFVLEQGTEVIIQQALGGSFTVTTELGYMARIDGKDADAIGKEPVRTPSELAPPPKNKKELEERIWEELKQCYDPEIPLNIVELGLIYGLQIEEIEDPKKPFKVKVVMTLTAPGCGMGAVLQDDVEVRVTNIHGVQSANVELVFDPPWDREMMSEAARLELGL